MFQPQRQPCRRHARTAGDERRSGRDPCRRQLVKQFLGRVDIGHCGVDAIAQMAVEDNRMAAIPQNLVAHRLLRRHDRRPARARRHHAHLRPEQIEQQPVPLQRLPVRPRRTGYQQDRLHREPGGDRRDISQLVGLFRGIGDQRVRPRAAQRPDREFQQPGLVAADTEPAQVIALDQQFNPERIRKARGGL